MGSLQLQVVHISGAAKDLRIKVGKPFSLALADFSDDANPQVASLSATVNWGDGGTTAGTVQSDGNGGYIVTGTHVYFTRPSHAFTVLIQDNANGFGPVSISGTVRMWPFAISH